MAKIISKRILEEIRFNNDIVEVIGSYLTLKRAGTSFKGLCPFHKEKTPSFHVNPQRQIFHCFGCGEGGDVFTFLMKFEGVDFTTAGRMLAEKANIKLELEDGTGEDGSQKDVLYRLHRDLAEFYRRCLLPTKGGERAGHYLARRSLSRDMIDTFMLGYAPDRWDAMVQWGEKNQYSEAQLEAAGVILRSQKANAHRRCYDRFRNRLIFPICDEQGRIIAFSGRTLEKDDKAAKYVNSPETPLFHKSRVLYALDKARRPIVASREAIICEGQIDVIRCHQLGFTTAVAAQGTAFTAEHARILARYADSVVIVFDADPAGQDAAVKTAAVFMEAALAVRVATLPRGEDPDSFLRERGADAFQTLLDNATSAVAFQADVLASRENMDTEVGVMRVARAVLETIKRSPNSVQRAQMIQEAAQRLGLPPSALQDDLRISIQRESRRAARRAVDREAKPGTLRDGVPPEERALCEHMMHAVDHPELLDLVETFLPADTLASSTARAVVAAAREQARTGRSLTELLDAGTDSTGEVQQFAAAVQMAPSKVKGQDFSHADAVRSLILRIWQRKLRTERETLADDDPQKRQLTRDIKELAGWDTGRLIIEMHLPG
jgi:DNA primase